MPAIKIPDQTKQLKQVPNSNVLGNIWSSCNLDLTENLGRIRVAPRGRLVDGTAGPSTLSNMQLPVAITFYDDGINERIWCIAGARMFYNSGNADDTFTQDATASTPTTLGTGCDMERFNGALYVAGNGDLYKYNSTWSTVSTVPNGGNAKMCVYGNRLYCTQSDSQIFSVNTSDVVVEATSTPNTNLYTLQLADFGKGGSSSNYISTIRAASDRIWIGIIDNNSQTHSPGVTGGVFEWDGVSAQATKFYPIDSVGVAALIVKDDIPYVVNGDGRLLKFNGQAFIDIARLPLLPSQYLRSITNSSYQTFLHANGIAIKDGRIIMLINNINQNTSVLYSNENIPSGIWEYDEKIGLYHKYSPSFMPAVATTRTDFFQNQVSEVGALYLAKSTNSTDNNGDIIYGLKYYTNATSTAYGVFTNDSDDTLSKCGYFVTTEIESQNLTDIWQKIYTKNKLLLSSADKVVVKYRINDVAPTEGLITWTSTTTFTSTLDLSSYVVGDEVEVTRGTGGGQIEHISTISYSNPTYTVTLENAVTGASGTARARFQKWKKILTVSNQTLGLNITTIDVKPSVMIQIKCVMYFTGKNELYELGIINVPSEKLQ